MAGSRWGGLGLTVAALVAPCGWPAVARAGSVAVWGEAATDPLPAAPPQSQAGPVVLHCLRGETVALQVGVLGPAGAASVEMEPVRSGTTAWATAIFEEDRGGDALAPVAGTLALTPRAPVALWVEVGVPPAAAAGFHRERLRIGDGALDLVFEVARQRLPATPLLRVTAASGVLGVPPREALAVPLATSRGVAAELLWGPAAAGPFDGRRFDHALRPLLDGSATPGLSALVLPRLDGLDDLQRFQWLLELRRHLGPLEARVVEYGDAGSLDDESAAALHRALPKAQLVLADDRTGEGDGVIVPIGRSNQVLSLDEAEAGAPPPLWWQLSSGGAPRFPTLARGGDRRALRALGWMAFCLDVRGIRLLPAAAQQALTAGDPPRPTVRLELLRAAIQDHALLALAYARDPAQTLIVARGVAARADVWPRESGAFEGARQRLFGILEATRPRRPSSAASAGTRRSRRCAGRARAAPGTLRAASAATPRPSGSAPRTGSAGASAR
jgi:hypothetical protein